MKSLKNEWEHIVSGNYIILVMVVPLLIALIFGFSFSKNQITEATVAVVDEDNSLYSRQLITNIDASQYVKVSEVFNNAVAPDTLLYNEYNYAVLYLPKGLEQNRYQGKSTNIGLFVDNAVPAKGASVRTGVQEVITGENASIAMGKLKGLGFNDEAAMGVQAPIALQQRLLYNPGGEFIGTMVVGMMNIVFISVMLSGPIAIVSRLRAAGLYEAELQKPVGLLSRVIPYAVIGAAGLLLSFALLKQLGGMRFEADPLSFSVPLLQYTLASCLLACVLGWSAPHPSKAIVRVLIMVILNMILGGVQAPTAMLPYSLQVLSDALPLSWFFRIVRGMGFRGGQLDSFEREMGALLLMSFVFVVIAAVFMIKDSRKLRSKPDLEQEANSVSAAVNTTGMIHPQV